MFELLLLFICLCGGILITLSVNEINQEITLSQVYYVLWETKSTICGTVHMKGVMWSCDVL